MFNPASLFEFSRTHCVAICAVLVPINLLTTLQTIALVGLNRSMVRILQAAGVASLCAIVMVLHVMTWFVIGVVMVPTYVLLTLGAVCLSINLWAISHPWSMRWLLNKLGQSLKLLQTRVTSPS